MRSTRPLIFWNYEMPFSPFLGVYVWPLFLQPWKIATPQALSQLNWEFIWTEFIYIDFCHLSIREKQKLPVAIDTRSLDDKSEKNISVNDQRVTSTNIQKMPQSTVKVSFALCPYLSVQVAKSPKWIICVEWVKSCSVPICLDSDSLDNFSDSYQLRIKREHKDNATKFCCTDELHWFQMSPKGPKTRQYVTFRLIQ